MTVEQEDWGAEMSNLQCVQIVVKPWKGVLLSLGWISCVHLSMRWNWVSAAEDDGERQYATVAVFHRAQTMNVQEKMTEPGDSDC